MFKAFRASTGFKLMTRSVWSAKAVRVSAAMGYGSKAMGAVRYMCTGNGVKGLDLQSAMNERLNESVREFKYEDLQDLKEGGCLFTGGD